MKLEVRSLEKVYRGRKGDVQALAPTSFTVSSGEFVSFVGPSGCGKSTTLYMIAGLDSPTCGEILLDGEPVTAPGRDRGMVFQNYTLFPWLTVLENTRFSFDLESNRDYSRTEGEVMTRVGRAYCMLDLMGLNNFYNAYPRELSGGMKQRVAIARALTNQPKLLLMDEPFGALDAQTREEMQELLLLLGAHEKTSTLFVTHDVEEAIYLSTRILVFSGRPGRILKEIAVPFGADRPLSIKAAPEFAALKRELLDLLHAGQPASFDREGLLQRLVQK
jgi:ABC-type nitrate/sulfonate/bicarbonate transport system ATPase subunit